MQIRGLVADTRPLRNPHFRRLWQANIITVVGAQLNITTLGLIGTSALFWPQAHLDNQDVWLLLCLLSVQQAFFAVNQPTRSAVLPKLLEPGLIPVGAVLGGVFSGWVSRISRQGLAVIVCLLVWGRRWPASVPRSRWPAGGAEQWRTTMLAVAAPSIVRYRVTRPAAL